MAEPTAKVGNIYGPDMPQSRSMADHANALDPTFDPNAFRKAEYYVFIHTVSDRQFTVCQPPLIPRIIFPARKKGERVSLVGRIPHPFNQLDREGGVGELMTRAHVGERVAMSLINPNNPSLDQDAIPPEKSVTGVGVNLSSQGVFWSRNEKAAEEEIKKAEARKSRYYQALLTKAKTLEHVNPKELEFILNQDYHMAADFFHVTTPWHQKFQHFEDCPTCGEQVKPGVAYHRNSFGLLCIIDAARAAKAGITPAMVAASVSQANLSGDGQNTLPALVDGE